MNLNNFTMQVENHRIFIKDLPETIIQSEIETTFSDYGVVKSVEIKERATSSLKKNQSLFFAYVNLEADNSSLQKCFSDFSQIPWHGQYIDLQIAKDHFLDRLKREREQSSINQLPNHNGDQVPPLKPVETNVISRSKPVITNGFKSGVHSTHKSSSESSASSDSDSSDNEKGIIHNDDDFDPIIIKNNKGKTLNSSLKIESVGNEPIIKIETKKRARIANVSEAESKRLKSVREMIKGYQQQKSLIKNALSRVDLKPENRITFDENNKNYSPKFTNNTKMSASAKKNLLFDEDDGDDLDDNYKNKFEIDPQFVGKKGKQLLSLQSKFKNDKRFKLDERFVEDEEEIQNGVENEEEMSMQEEKEKELAILESVLGGKLKQKHAVKTKGMVRFDPNQPEHAKYEIQNEILDQKDKKKQKEKKKIEGQQESSDQPVVSKDVFYTVEDNLKETLGKCQEFSLLGMLGRDHTENVEDQEYQYEEIAEKSTETNPFQYDSSDNEEPTEKEEVTKTDDDKGKKPTNFWSEPFFFREDDYRLQDAADFMNRIATEDCEDFGGLRRKLKEIVRAKVRNNQRKDKPFKKKLGGNKRKKMIRIKKAIKR